MPTLYLCCSYTVTFSVFLTIYPSRAAKPMGRDHDRGSASSLALGASKPSRLSAAAKSLLTTHAWYWQVDH